MERIILQYITERFGQDRTSGDCSSHYSYCSFPAEDCSCKSLGIITANTSLIQGGYIDSFSMVSVLVFIEREFNIKIPEKDATPYNFDSVNRMIDLIKSVKNKS